MAKGSVKLELRNVEQESINEDNITIRLVRFSEQKILLRFPGVSSPPDPTLSVPAFPDEKNLVLRINTSRYRQIETEIFTLQDGQSITKSLNLFRKPDKWRADFISWTSLSNQFKALKELLVNSLSVRILHGKTLGKLVEQTYDNFTENKDILAKACLLNLFAKLTDLTEPVTGGDAPWFSFATNLLAIGRERFVAVAKPEIHDIVQKIRENEDKFKLYKRVGSDLHHKNFLGLGYQVPKTKMIGIKSDEDHGNIQLTVVRAKDSAGNQVTLLDADIDENGKLLDHVADVFKHKFTGGTHPFDIHEYLVSTNKTRSLGYILA